MAGIIVVVRGLVNIILESQERLKQWIIKTLSPTTPAWVRVVEPAGRWSRIIVMPKATASTSTDGYGGA